MRRADAGSLTREGLALPIHPTPEMWCRESPLSIAAAGFYFHQIGF